MFLDFAIENLSRQDLTHLREVLVTPDHEPPGYMDLARDKIRRLEHRVPVRIVSMRRRDKALARAAGNPSACHFLQLHTGICAATSRHVLFHDADFFIRPGDFLRRRYELMESNGYSVLGIDPRQAKFVDGCTHLTATWEMLASSEWLRAFPPYYHKAQEFPTGGGMKHFDTTLYPQYLSSPEEITWRTPREQEYVHFNQVISHYRHFSRTDGDVKRANLKLLLIRILIEALASDEWRYKLPAREDWLGWLEQRIRDSEGTEISDYGRIRGRVERLLNLGIFEASVQARIRECFRPFDLLMGCEMQDESLSVGLTK